MVVAGCYTVQDCCGEVNITVLCVAIETIGDHPYPITDFKTGELLWYEILHYGVQEWDRGKAVQSEEREGEGIVGKGVVGKEARAKSQTCLGRNPAKNKNKLPAYVGE